MAWKAEVMNQETHAVTGAFGYSGKYITQRLLDRGRRVITLTNSPDRPNPFRQEVKAFPYRFTDPDGMAETLEGVAVLYNTYWVRFNYRDFSHNEAVRNSMMLFEAARKAGVRRIVHVSITNPSAESQLEYFSGKARLERCLAESSLSHAILRPAVLFGGEDVLINNIAWLLRRSPLFGIFGDGEYRLQPIHVEDLAEIAVREGAKRENSVINAIGPETFTYRELVSAIGKAIGKERPFVYLPPWLGYLIGRAIGACEQDVFITRDEIRGLMDDLLHVNSPPAGWTKLSAWAQENADSLGQRYASELSRRFNREREYV
jgi:nucleoside-diphosphate-sugar epimerase